LISEITQWIMESMRTHGQLAVFIGVMIEQIIVPIPSPLIIMGAGPSSFCLGFPFPMPSFKSSGSLSFPLSRLDLGFLYWLYDQFLWRESPGVAVTAFFGCGLGQIERLEKRFQGGRKPGASFSPELFLFSRSLWFQSLPGCSAFR